MSSRPEPDRPASSRSERLRSASTGDAAVDAVLEEVRDQERLRSAAGQLDPADADPNPADPNRAGPAPASPDPTGPDVPLAVRRDELAAAHHELRALLDAAPPEAAGSDVDGLGAGGPDR